MVKWGYMNTVSIENLKTTAKSNWGGIREGSGRKPKLQYEVRELFNRAVDEEWGNIMEAILIQARNGDKDTLKWLIEQRIGKAPQNMAITAQGAFLSVSEAYNKEASDNIVEIARRVSEELKILKTG